MTNTKEGNGSIELLSDVLTDYIKLALKSNAGDKFDKVILELRASDGKSCKLDIDYTGNGDEE